MRKYHNLLLRSKNLSQDLSVEVPNAPEVFLEREARLSKSMFKVTPGRRTVYEVVLTLTITAKIKSKVLFLVEAEAGLFRSATFHSRIWVRCSHRVPEYSVLYAKTVSTVTARAGFPPVVLAPMTFEGIYQQQLQQMQHKKIPNRTEYAGERTTMGLRRCHAGNVGSGWRCRVSLDRG